tara:strand:+ start:286 stop:450 length:165 start_codon:yes stop_codon:yes gene_type:complete
MKNDEHIVIDGDTQITDNICEECKKEDISVKSNLIISSYKICDSCKLSKTIFPV